MNPRPKKRLARVLSLLFISILIGFIAGGWVLDERPPSDRDLRAPEPHIGGDDPFQRLIEHPPEVSFNTYPFLSLTEETEAVESSALQEARRESRRWLADFDRHFGRVGGDPRVLERELFPKLSGIQTIWRKGPFPFEKLLRAMSQLELHFDDPDQAFFSLSVALRLESWQAIYHPESTLRPLFGLLDELTDAIEAGESQGVDRRAVLEGLIAWYPSEELQRARLLHHYNDRKPQILDPEQWWLSLPGTPRHRIKFQRTLRRFGEVVRQRIADPLDFGRAEARATSALVRAWIDPHGDTILDLELGYLDDLRDELLTLEKRSTLARIALALLLRESEWESLPESLDELVPDYISELPIGPLRPIYDREERQLKFLDATPWRDESLQLPGPSR